jgi:hypothetical protein
MTTTDYGIVTPPQEKPGATVTSPTNGDRPPARALYALQLLGSGPKVASGCVPSTRSITFFRRFDTRMSYKR